MFLFSWDLKWNYRYFVQIIEGSSQEINSLSEKEKNFFPMGHFQDEPLSIYVGARAILYKRLDRWFQIEKNDRPRLEQFPWTDGEKVASRFAKIIPLSGPPDADPRSTGLTAYSNFVKTVIDHCPMFGMIKVRHVPDGASVYEGIAVKTSEENWSGFFGSQSAQKCTSMQIETQELLLGTSFKVILPEICNVSDGKIQKNANRRNKRLEFDAKQKMEKQAIDILKAQAKDRDFTLFSKVVKKWGVENDQYASFEEFEAILRESRQPLEANDLKVINPTTGAINDWSAVYYPGDEGPAAAINKISQDALKDFLSKQQGSKDKSKKKQGYKVISTKSGSNSLIALQQYRQGEKENKKQDSIKRREKLKKQVEKMEKLLTEFRQFKETRPADFWVIKADEKQKVLDYFIRLFFPDSAMASKSVADKRNFLIGRAHSGDFFSERGLNDAVAEKEQELSQMKKEIEEDDEDSLDDSDDDDE